MKKHHLVLVWPPWYLVVKLYLTSHMVIESKVLKNFQIILIEPKCSHKSLCHNIKFDMF
jgi:hypothetical protein